MSLSYTDEILPTIDFSRSPNITGIVSAMAKDLPNDFPIHIWTEQVQRYLNFWYWWSGKIFEEVVGTTADGEPLYRFPLKINPIRSYSRLHNGILWGEFSDDAMLPVTMSVKPHDIYYDDKSLDPKFIQNIIHSVWDQSNGGSVLVEAGLLTQFLGGIFFQIVYQPWKKNLTVPGLWIKMLKPDFVLPIWDPEDEFKIIECYIVYRISGSTAKRQYGVESKNSILGMVNYVEHWTEDSYSIQIDGQYVNFDFGDGKMEYKDVPNPFGFVPVYYVPRLREGNFYGSSIISEISGMVMEYNARWADLGDIVSKQNDIKYFGRNLSSSVRMKQLENGTPYFDLGTQPPGSTHTPELKSDVPPSFTSAMTDYVGGLQAQMERESNLSPVSFGSDEGGSQRSGQSLSVRMHPTITVARQQRKNWQTVFSAMNRDLIIMLFKLKIPVAGKFITEDMTTKYLHGCKWSSYIPIDELALTNRIVLLRQSHNMSLERALELQPDVENVVEEAQRINAELDKLAEQQNQQQGANTSLEEPVADTTPEEE